jgi:hypothetical protein
MERVHPASIFLVAAVRPDPDGPGGLRADPLVMNLADGSGILLFWGTRAGAEIFRASPQFPKGPEAAPSTIIELPPAHFAKMLEEYLEAGDAVYFVCDPPPIEEWPDNLPPPGKIGTLDLAIEIAETLASLGYEYE